MAVNSHVAMEDSSLTLNQLKKESFPFVFQCKGCNDIIGDSSNFISSDQELEVISLNGKPSTFQTEQLKLKLTRPQGLL